MPSEEVLRVVEGLTDDERVLLRVLARTSKEKTNVFNEGQLRKKKALENVDVHEVLRSLAAAGLVNPVKRRVWQTTKLGREAEHFLLTEWIWSKHGLRVVRL